MIQIRKKKCDFYTCAAWLISVIFHPVFIPFYVLLVFLSISHYFFYDINKITRLIFLSTVVVPLLIQFLLYRLKILHSFFLVRLKARIGFTLLMAVIYYLLYRILDPIAVLEYFALFFRGIALSLLLAVLFNLSKKRISLHGLAMGGALYFLLHWSYTHRTNILDIISISIGITSLVLAARLKLKAHTLDEIAIGLFIGIAGQALSFWLS